MESGTSDIGDFGWRLQQQEFTAGEPSGHDRFEFETDTGNAMIVCISRVFTNDSCYLDYVFEGGLFVTIDAYLDEDLKEQLRLLVLSFAQNKYYEITYKS